MFESASDPPGSGSSSCLTMADLIEVGIIVLTEDGCIALWNEWIARRTGVAPASATGRRLHELFPGQVSQALLVAIDECLNHGRSRSLSASLHRAPLPLRSAFGDAADPPEHGILVRSVKRAERPRRCLIQITDVSSAAARERALREQVRAKQAAVARLTGLLESSMDGILQLHSDGTILSANRAAERLFGRVPGGLNGQPLVSLIPSLACVHGSDMVATIRSLIGRRQEHLAWRADGSVFPSELSVSEIGGDAVHRFSAFVRDISQRKMFERELEDNNARLAQQTHALAAVADRLERSLRQAEHMRVQAETANQTKTNFLAMMSHELRTPLNAILGFAEMIENRIFGDKDADIYATYGQYIRKSGAHLLSLVNDLLDLAKIEAGKMTIRRDPIDIRYLGLACLALMQGQAREREVELVAMLPESLAPLLADERLVKQMMLNLLSNAIKFTLPRGRVVLGAEVDMHGATTVTVHDSGVGMNAEDLARALEPFGQANDLLVRHHQGTGLGLPLVRSLMELHGGELDIRTAPGQGTTARLRFPPNQVVAVQRVAG